MKLMTGIVLCLHLGLTTASVSAQTMNLNQILQKVIDHYPSLKAAAIQVERARQDAIRVESQLAWQLSGKGGISRNMSLFGTPTDRVDVSGNLGRSLESGGTLSLNASLSREDATTTFSPVLPNPSVTSSLDLKYRHPLAKGADNPAFSQAKEKAMVSKMISSAEQQAMHDKLATQLIDLYIAASTTQSRIHNTQQAIARTKRLQTYIKDRSGLGLSEDKDILQVNAQLSGQQAEYQSLQIRWTQQRIALNRLMGRDWSDTLELVIDNSDSLPDQSHDDLFQQASLRSPAILKVNEQLKLVDTAIKLSRDAKKDNLDLLMVLGNQTYGGDTVTGSQSESEIFGGVSLEFKRGLDKSGYDAEIYQAQLDRSVALQNKKQIMEDLYYDLSSLLMEIKVSQQTVQAYQLSVTSEQKKLKEAEQRYKDGRTDTDQLIQFESHLSQAMLAYELQKIELNKRQYNLSLLLGELWKNIKLPDYSFLEAEE
ncbi:MAG: TolC family protein [Gammaproteobacteria bacterium]|nr:TolC family protein [Gammaproteobacteria bacterium]